MMVDEPRTSEEPSLAPIIEEVLGKLESERIVPREAGEKVVEKAPKPFIEEVYGVRDHEAGAYAKVEHEEDAPEVFSRVEESCNLMSSADTLGSPLGTRALPTFTVRGLRTIFLERSRPRLFGP